MKGHSNESDRSVPGRGLPNINSKNPTTKLEPMGDVEIPVPATCEPHENLSVPARARAGSRRASRHRGSSPPLQPPRLIDDAQNLSIVFRQDRIQRFADWWLCRRLPKIRLDLSAVRRSLLLLNLLTSWEYT